MVKLFVEDVKAAWIVNIKTGFLTPIPLSVGLQFLTDPNELGVLVADGKELRVKYDNKFALHWEIENLPLKSRVVVPPPVVPSPPVVVVPPVPVETVTDKLKRFWDEQIIGSGLPSWDDVFMALAVVPLPVAELFNIGRAALSIKITGWVEKLGLARGGALLDDLVVKESKLLERGVPKSVIDDVAVTFKEVIGSSFDDAVKRGLTDSEISWVVNRVKDVPLRAVEMFIKKPSNWERVGWEVQQRVLKALAETEATFSYDVGKQLLQQMGVNAGGKLFAQAGRTGLWNAIHHNWKWFIGVIASIAGMGFAVSWAEKEAVWEATKFPVTDLIRDEKWVEVEKQLPSLGATLDHYESILDTWGWMNPISRSILKEGIKKERENLVLWKKLTSEALAAGVPETFEEKLRRMDEERRKSDEEYWQKVEEQRKADEAARKAEEEAYWKELEEQKAAAESLRKKSEEDYYARIEKEKLEKVSAQKLADEAYWAKVKAEQDALESERKKSNEEYWRRVNEQLEDSKAVAREEEKAYWDGLLQAQRERREAERLAEEEYWSRVQAEADLRKLESREAEQAYWEQVWADNAARDEEKRLREEAYWQEVKNSWAATDEEGVPYVSTTPTLPTYAPIEEILIPEYGIQPIPTPHVKRTGALVVNIETTGIKPWDSQIIAIGFMDSLSPEKVPTVLTSHDEKTLIRSFLTLFKLGGYTKIIGYNAGFDYRFIIVKAMKYGLGCQEWFNTYIIDLMRALQYGTTEYVWGSPVSGKLTDWAEYYFNDPKLITDADMIKAWSDGRFSVVEDFASGQVRRTYNLWLLWDYTTSLPFMIGKEGETIHTPVSSSKTSELSIKDTTSQTVNCPVCMAEVTIPQGENKASCPICKTVVSRKWEAY